MNPKEIGTIGESVAITEFIKLGISSCVETLRDASRTDEEKVQTTNK